MEWMWSGKSIAPGAEISTLGLRATSESIPLCGWNRGAGTEEVRQPEDFLSHLSVRNYLPLNETWHSSTEGTNADSEARLTEIARRRLYRGDGQVRSTFSVCRFYVPLSCGL